VLSDGSKMGGRPVVVDGEELGGMNAREGLGSQIGG